MSFDSRFDPLRLHADITLSSGGGTVLQKPLHQGNVITTVFVNLRSVPFAETVSADALKAQIPSFLECWDYPIRKMIGLLRLKPLRPNAKAAARRIFRRDDGLFGHGQQPHGRRDRRSRRGRCRVFKVRNIFKKQLFLQQF